MRLLIHNEFSPELREKLSAAFLILTRKLGISEYKGTIELYNGLFEDELGGCIPNPSPPKGKAPRSFVMNLACRNHLSWRSVLRTFCHEMVHIKQWLTGQSGVDWDGKHTWYNLRIGKEDLPYYHQPWEVEARNLEVPLAAWVQTKLKEGSDG